MFLFTYCMWHQSTQRDGLVWSENVVTPIQSIYETLWISKVFRRLITWLLLLVFFLEKTNSELNKWGAFLPLSQNDKTSIV